MFRKRLVSLALVSAMIFLLNVSNVFAASGGVSYVDSNNVPHLFVCRQQPNAYWCWAAASQMGGDFYNGVRFGTQTTSLHTQTEIVTHVKGSPVLEGANNPSEVIDAYNYAGWPGAPFSELSTSYALASNFSYSNMKGFVNLHKPTIACLVIAGTPIQGHAVVVTEYDDKTSASSDDSIRLADPWTDGYYGWLTYSSFVSGFSIGGTTGYFGQYGGYSAYGVYLN